MRDGRIEQAGPPETLYRRPRTRFAATFLGRAVLVDGWVRAGLAETALGAFPTGRPDGPVTLALRPEDLSVDPSGGVRGRLIQRLFLGQEGVAYRVKVDGLELRCPAPTNGCRPPEVGEEVGLTVLHPPAVLDD